MPLHNTGMSAFPQGRSPPNIESTSIFLPLFPYLG
jgi:hypothetical protein